MRKFIKITAIIIIPLTLVSSFAELFIETNSLRPADPISESANNWYIADSFVKDAATKTENDFRSEFSSVVLFYGISLNSQYNRNFKNYAENNINLHYNIPLVCYKIPVSAHTSDG